MKIVNPYEINEINITVVNNDQLYHEFKATDIAGNDYNFDGTASIIIKDSQYTEVINDNVTLETGKITIDTDITSLQQGIYNYVVVLTENREITISWGTINKVKH
jgi:hypothetical protein